MAVHLIPNQLVKLYDTETFNQRNKRLTLDYRTYCQIVREEQTTMFQVRLTPDSVNLLTNGDFTTDISGWNVTQETWQFASGRAQAIKTTYGNPNIYQEVATTIGRAYVLRGTAQFTDTANRLTIIADQGGTVAQTIDADDYGLDPFNFELFFTSDQANVLINFILSGGVPGMMFIDDVTLYRLSEPAVTLETCEGTTVRTIEPFARALDVITYAVEWAELPETCYRICMTGTDDTEKNYLDDALALSTEGGEPIELEQGGYLKWFG